MKNKVVLITGASSGLGEKFALEYAKKGYDMVLVARSTLKLLALKEQLENLYGITVWVCSMDLSKENGAQLVFEYCKNHDIKISTLINNAGFGDYANFYECDITKQKNMIQVNITALIELTYLFLPAMIHDNEGYILNVASMASLSAGPKMAVYFASKAFVRSFSEALHEELKSYRIKVSALCPGPVKTGFGKAANYKSSKLTSQFATMSALAVVKAGIKACEVGRAICYPGTLNKSVVFLNQLMPRKITRWIVKQVNR